jgi:hypothetical protein
MITSPDCAVVLPRITLLNPARNPCFSERQTYYFHLIKFSCLNRLDNRPEYDLIPPMTPMCHRSSQGPFPRAFEFVYPDLALDPDLDLAPCGALPKIRTKCVQNEYTFQNAKSVNAVVIAAYDKKHGGFPFDGQKTRPKPDRFQTKKGGGDRSISCIPVSLRGYQAQKRIKANKSEWKIKFDGKKVSVPLYRSELK